MGPGLVAELPILSQNPGGRARAAAELEQAGRRYLAVKTVVAADVQSALIRLTEARGAERVLAQAIGESLATERRQAQQLYEAGEISLLELLATRRRLGEIETTRLEAGMNAARAGIRLEQAIGRPCAAQ
jgi:outer membrane protein TolC